MRIYVGNLSYETTADNLKNLFGQHGEVRDVYVPTDRETGRGRGFAFVEMANDDEGQAAIEALNDTEAEGRTITVNVARPRVEDGRGGGRRDEGGGGDRW